MDLFFPVHQSDVLAFDRALMDRLHRVDTLRAKASAAYGTMGERLYTMHRRHWTELLDQWTWLRGYMRDRRETLSAAEGIGAMDVIRRSFRDAAASSDDLERELDAAIARKSQPPQQPAQGQRRRPLYIRRAVTAGADGEIGAMGQPLTYQIGIAHGHAVGYCPATGHVIAEPLRDHARRLHQRGHIGDDEIGADLYDVLEGLHVGDDLALEAGYDLVEVGASKKRKAKRKARRAKIKGAIKKTVKAAKTSVKNGLSRAIKATVSIANPAAGVALMALSKGKKIAKKSNKGNAKATQTVNAATAVTAARSPQAKKSVIARAGKAGVPRSDVRKTAQALTIAQAAQDGDPMAQQIVNTDDAIENASVEPLDPESFPLAEPQGEESPSPASYSEAPSEDDGGGEMPADSGPPEVPDWGDEDDGGGDGEDEE